MRFVEALQSGQTDAIIVSIGAVTAFLPTIHESGLRGYGRSG